MVFCIFTFTFYLETTFGENNWIKTTFVTVIVFFFFFLKMLFRKYLITAIFGVLSQQLRGTLATAFERHLTIEDFTDMDVKPAPRHLTYYCMLLIFSNMPKFKLKLIL